MLPKVTQHKDDGIRHLRIIDVSEVDMKPTLQPALPCLCHHLPQFGADVTLGPGEFQHRLASAPLSNLQCVCADVRV